MLTALLASLSPAPSPDDPGLAVSAPPRAAWVDANGDGRADLLVPEADGGWRLYLRAPDGRFQPAPSGVGTGAPAPPSFEVVCAIGVQDQALPSECLPASSVPALGALYPLSAELYVDAGTGSVGMGTTAPTQRLDVDGTIRSRQGGVEFPDGTLQATASAGITGGVANDTARNDGNGWIPSSLLQNDGTRVAVGTSPAPFAMLSVSADPLGADSALLGDSWGAAGQGAGVRGANFSGTGRGVWGQALGVLPEATGVEGESVFGTGVRGLGTLGVVGVGTETAPGPGQTVIGVDGRSDYDEGIGVRGTASSVNGFGVFSDGNLQTTGTKNFVNPHPEDPGREVRFVCLEGNESGTYFRGSARTRGGRAVISVPEEFRLVTAEEGLTVQLTAVGSLARLAVVRRDLHAIEVAADGDEVAFDYFVNGVRRGFEDHEPLQPNQSFVPRVAGVPYGEHLPPGLRAVLVENGILNPDGTPNEATAAALGWELEDPAELEAREARRREQRAETRRRGAER